MITIDEYGNMKREELPNINLSEHNERIFIIEISKLKAIYHFGYEYFWKNDYTICAGIPALLKIDSTREAEKIIEYQDWKDFKITDAEAKKKNLDMIRQKGQTYYNSIMFSVDFTFNKLTGNLNNINATIMLFDRYIESRKHSFIKNQIIGDDFNMDDCIVSETDALVFDQFFNDTERTELFPFSNEIMDYADGLLNGSKNTRNVFNIFNQIKNEVEGRYELASKIWYKDNQIFVNLEDIPSNANYYGDKEITVNLIGDRAFVNGHIYPLNKIAETFKDLSKLSPPLWFDPSEHYGYKVSLQTVLDFDKTEPKTTKKRFSWKGID